MNVIRCADAEDVAARAADAIATAVAAARATRGAAHVALCGRLDAAALPTSCSGRC